MSFTSRHQSQVHVHPSTNRDIQLTILEGDRLRVFQLSANDERVVTVGATSSADIQFDAPDISPIHFYFERLEDDVWIVPAYCVSGLRLNQVNVTTPQRLSARAQVKFSGIVLDLELARPTCAKLSAQSGVHSDVHPRGLDTDLSQDDEPTQQAWAPLQVDQTAHQRSIVTVMVPRPALVSALARAVSDTSDSAEVNANGAPQASTVQISSIIAVPFECRTPYSEYTPTGASLRMNVEVPSLKQTLYGVSPSLFGTDDPRLAAPPMQRRMTQVRAPAFAIRTRHRNNGPLFRLGRLAKRRPLAVFTAAIVGALLCALIVVLATNAILHSRHTGQFEKSPIEFVTDKG